MATNKKGRTSPFATPAPQTPPARRRQPIIAIAGLVGSGKNTVGIEVARRLGWRVVEPTFKTLAAREGISLMEFQKKAMKDENIDKKFDDALKEECAGGKCVVTTWLGPWMAPGRVFKVWLDVEEKIRVERIAKRDGMKAGEASAHIRKRDADNRARYRKVYGIDISDHSKFDLVVKVKTEPAEEIAKLITNSYEG